MFNFLKKKEVVEGEKAVLKINGMHCVSCSMSIDGELEDLPGVTYVKTSYAKGETAVAYDPKKVELKKIVKVVEGLGYVVRF